jgi:hypothetical protein
MAYREGDPIDEKMNHDVILEESNRKNKEQVWNFIKTIEYIRKPFQAALKRIQMGQYDHLSDAHVLPVLDCAILN